MSLRIRESGEVLCAAHHPAQEGDVYLDDAAHYRLSVGLRVLVTEPMPRHAEPANPLFGQWWWEGRVPEGVEVERWWARE